MLDTQFRTSGTAAVEAVNQKPMEAAAANWLGSGTSSCRQLLKSRVVF